MRWSGPTVRPAGVRRFTAHQASMSGAAGPIGRSECRESGTPRRNTDAARTIVSARAAPSPCTAY